MKYIRRIGSLMIISLLALSAPLYGNEFTAEQKAEIQKIVTNHLLDNPEILAQAAQRYQQKQMELQAKQSKDRIKQHASTIFSTKSSPSEGNPNGNIVLVEFFDYQCGHCKTMNAIINQLAKANPDLKVIYKELPIFGEDSRHASKLALAAHKMGNYKAVHNAFMSEGAKLTKDKVNEVLSKLNLNISDYEKASKDNAFSQEISQNTNVARKVGIRGTPAFIIAKNVGKPDMEIVFIPGASNLMRLQQAIDSLKTSSS